MEVENFDAKDRGLVPANWVKDEVHNQQTPMVIAQADRFDSPSLKPILVADQTEAPKTSGSDLPNRFELNEHFFSSLYHDETL